MNIPSSFEDLSFEELNNICDQYFKGEYITGTIEYVKDHFFDIQTVCDIERLVKEYIEDICAIQVDEPHCPIEVDESELCCSLDDDEGCDRKAELIDKIVQSILKNTQR